MQLAGYKVKCMLAEPKSKGHREAQPSAELHTAHLYQVTATRLRITMELPAMPYIIVSLAVLHGGST